MTPKQSAHWRKLTQMGQLVMVRKILNNIPESVTTKIGNTTPNDVHDWLDQLTKNIKERK